MKKSRIFISLLICALLLVQGALAAMVMTGEEVTEVPVIDQLPAAVMETPAAPVGEQAPVKAELTDSHNHTGWTWLTQSNFGVSKTMTLGTGEYYLGGDVTGKINVIADATVSLCLNGHTLDADGDGSVITVAAGATLYLDDCAGGGQLTGGSAASGAGVKILSGATFEMYAGTITGNASVGRSGRLAYGGGVYVAAGTFRMYGGTISGNSAVEGGGVAVSSNATFTMTGGSITGNTAATIGSNTASGGGVSVGAGAVFAVSGAPVVTGNTADGGTSNVWLANSATITVEDALENTATIGVKMATIGTITSSAEGIVPKDHRTRFVSDDAAYGVGADEEGELFLNTPFTVTYVVPTGVTGTAPAPFHGAVGEAVVVDTTAVLTKAGYQFIGWTDSLGYPRGRTTIRPTEDTTMYPVFATGFEDTGISTTIDMTYGEKIDEIDLNDFVRDTTAGSGTTFRFGLRDGADSLPKGLKLVDKDGEEKGSRYKITGTAIATPGEYPVVFTVNHSGSSAVLFSLADSPSFGRGELTLVFRVAKPPLTEDDFEFTPPEDLAYDGTAKEAVVTPRRGVVTGDITLKYAPAAPVELGTYTVTIDVAEGSKFQAATDLGKPEWTFSIRLGTPKPDGVTYGGALSAVPLPSGWAWAEPDTIPTVTNSGYEAVYTIPAGGTYDWSEEEGYNANGTVTRTVQLAVRKATPSYTVPTGLTAKEGQTLADVRLPAGWSWFTPESTSVGQRGEHIFIAVYTPEDTNNYNSVPRVQLTVNVVAEAVVSEKVDLGAPQWADGKTTIALTPTPATLLTATGTKALAARFEGNDMKDLAIGELNGDGSVVTFDGVELKRNEGWRLFFLSNSYMPLCAKCPLN